MPLINKDIALKLLMNHEVVALPTETVYGLAGMVNSEEALSKIFSIKSRPFFDPLIIHVRDLEQARGFAHFDNISKRLARSFWPGPLTLVLRKKENVSDLITNGGPTVALRAPNHPVFLDVLKRLSAPLAAPSANMFGKTSPTTAQHVIDEFADKVSVVDGGPCEKGIESTVVQFSKEEQKLYILRSGLTTQGDLENFMKKENLTVEVEHKKQTNTPGHLKNHYQPTSPLYLVEGCELDSLPAEALDLLKSHCSTKIIQWSLPTTASLAARQVYADLRGFSKDNQACYFIVPPAWESEGAWHGLLDRLRKAAHFTVRQQLDEWRLSSKD